MNMTLSVAREVLVRHLDDRILLVNGHSTVGDDRLKGVAKRSSAFPIADGGLECSDSGPDCVNLRYFRQSKLSPAIV